MAPALQSPPTRSIAVGVSLVVALFLCGAWITARSYADLHAMVGNELELRFLAGELLFLREEMATSARLAAETGAGEWEARYREVQPQFDDALRRAVADAPGAAVAGSPTWTASAALAATEIEALALVRAGQRTRAVALLASPQFKQRQADYERGLQSMAADMLGVAQQRLAAERSRVIAAAVLGLCLLAALAAAWAWISGLVQQYLHKVEAAELALAETNRGLEARVRERTAELTALNAQLRAEMEQRTKMELELRQSQKLEAVGRLASGVAHEINTPVQFVADSCHFLHESVATLLALLARYRDALDAVAGGRVPAAQARRETEDARSVADAEYLVEQSPQATARALDGLERIAQIVRSMKEFAYHGRERTRADLNRAIASTLTIARNEYKYVADVHTDFGELPPIDCHIGELNQALLNLVVNASHAIADSVKGTQRRGTITVRTRRDGGDVVIAVQDDGCGIPPSIRDKIFDPFFTTKEIGKGSGQGLAIARAVVVDKHGGRLLVDSEVGRGTTFTIRIPAEPPAQWASAA
jgi:signal transduction histidine kinase